MVLSGKTCVHTYCPCLAVLPEVNWKWQCIDTHELSDACKHAAKLRARSRFLAQTLLKDSCLNWSQKAGMSQANSCDAVDVQLVAFMDVGTILWRECDD